MFNPEVVIMKPTDSATDLRVTVGAEHLKHIQPGSQQNNNNKS
uniref:Uncharacterized protein n=1 Tax=Arundo donax TaxID=35708 RepID=A0A0A9C507_ARUDO